MSPDIAKLPLEGGQNRPCENLWAQGTRGPRMGTMMPTLHHLPVPPEGSGLWQGRGAFLLPHSPPKSLGKESKRAKQRASGMRVSGDGRPRSASNGGVGRGAPLRCPELRLALKEMISTCLLSSAAPRLQIKNQLRAGRRICQAEAVRAGGSGPQDGWMGATGRGEGLRGPRAGVGRAQGEAP